MNVSQRSQEIASLTDHEFERFRLYARSACGISLQQNKKALVSSRLERVLRRNGWNSFSQYIEILSARPHSPEWTEFIDCLTTNHTWFFRENEHFAFLKKEVFTRTAGPLRIWSSACATGEEPYSIAISALESGVRDLNILATDISSSALREAERGTFELSRLSGLEPVLRDRYMTPVVVPGSQQKVFSVAARVRKSIRFAPINLQNNMDHVGRFHVVFCRNVMIYFDREVQDALVARLTERIQKGGFLFTGHSESLLRIPESLEYVRPAIYRKVP